MKTPNVVPCDVCKKEVEWENVWPILVGSRRSYVRISMCKSCFHSPQDIGEIYATKKEER